MDGVVEFRNTYLKDVAYDKMRLRGFTHEFAKVPSKKASRRLIANLFLLGIYL